jgi:hypothetical protein
MMLEVLAAVIAKGQWTGVTNIEATYDLILGSAPKRASRRMGHVPHGSRRPLTRAPHHEGLSKPGATVLVCLTGKSAAWLSSPVCKNIPVPT